jgi:hypothetical protein
LNKERAQRLQRVVDSVDERHDNRQAVEISWGELRTFLALQSAAEAFATAAEDCGFLDSDMAESFGALVDATDAAFRCAEPEIVP